MKKLLLLCSWMCMLGITLPLFAVSTPAADDGKWYYVKSQRFNTGGPWWTFDATGKFVVPGALTKTDAQKFTLVSVGGTTKVTIKEFSGNKLTATNVTGSVGVYDATGAATGWTITPNTVQGVIGTAFPGENSGIHQGGSGWSWHVSAGYYSLADNSTFFFYEATPDVDLNIAIDDAINKITVVSVGTGVGQTPQAAVDAYQTAINTAKTTLGSTDQTAIQNAISTLATATSTFIAAKVPIVQSSTEATPIWYLIKNTSRGGKGATTYTNGFNAQLKCTTAANTVSANGTSTGSAAPSLAHLFRFEKQSDLTYRIINAALPNGEVLQGANGGSSSAQVKYGTVATPATKWNLNLIGANATLGVTEIKFVSAGNGTVWHDDSGNSIVSWDGGSASASSWYVEQYTGDVTALYQTQYDAVVNQYNITVDANGNAVSPYVIGVQPGQYDAVKFQAVKDAYTAMVNEKNTNGINSINMVQKMADVSAAIATFAASKVLPPAYGGTIDVTKTYTLKLVQPGAALDGYYMSNPRVDANNGSDAGKPFATFSQNIDPTTCLWKITASTSSAGKYIITSTRRAGSNEYLDEYSRVRDASSYSDSQWTTKYMLQNTLTYTAGTTLLIIKMDPYANYISTLGTVGATTGGNTAAWSTFSLEQYTITATQPSTISDVKVTAVNRMLVITGTTEMAKAYTVTGAQVDATKALNPGIYIVKVAGKTVKVNVQ